MSKRKAHDNVAYVNGGFAERIASHLVGKSWLCGYSTDSKAPLNGCHDGACVECGNKKDKSCLMTS